VLCLSPTRELAVQIQKVRPEKKEIYKFTNTGRAGPG
jgi:superfamily II DNA/RNA helicase